MANEKTHLERGKIVMSKLLICCAQRKALPSDTGKLESELQYLISKDKVLQRLRECAENVKEGNPTIKIPDNCCRLEPGTYTGEQLGAVIYFIADMLE